MKSLSQHIQENLNEESPSILNITTKRNQGPGITELGTSSSASGDNGSEKNEKPSE